MDGDLSQVMDQLTREYTGVYSLPSRVSTHQARKIAGDAHGSSLVISGYLNGTPVEAVVDTAAQITVASQDFYNSMKYLLWRVSGRLRELGRTAFLKPA